MSQPITIKLAGSAATVLFSVVTGCGSGSTADASSKPNDLRPPEAIAQVDRGTRVTVLSEDGDFAQVRTSTGEEFYIPASLLRQRSTLIDDDSYSHLLTAPANALPTPLASCPSTDYPPG